MLEIAVLALHLPAPAVRPSRQVYVRLRSADRFWYGPGYRVSLVGFRVAKALR